MANVEVKGLRELMLALEKLPQEVQKKPVQQALRAAAKPMRDDAMSRVPRETGTVQKNIVVQRSKLYNGKNFVYGVVLRVRNMSKRLKKSKGYAGDPFYWKFLEFGTAKMPARPFMRPAFEGNKDKAIQIIRERLARGIENEARKLNRGR